MLQRNTVNNFSMILTGYSFFQNSSNVLQVYLRCDWCAGIVWNNTVILQIFGVVLFSAFSVVNRLQN